MIKPLIAIFVVVALVAAHGCVVSVQATPTPNIDATVQAALEASIPTPTPVPTPDVDATVSAAVEATQRVSEPTPTETALPIPTNTTVPTSTNTPEPTPTHTSTPEPSPTELPTTVPTQTPIPTPTSEPLPTERVFYGPESGELVPDENGIAWGVSAVDISDFVVEVELTIPEHISDRGWLACISSRATTPNDIELGIPVRGHSVCFNSLAGWFHASSENQDALLHESSSRHFLTASGHTNQITIVATGSRAWLFVNGEYIDELDFSSVTESGAITLAVVSEGGVGSTRYEDFRITPLRRVFGPADGEIKHQIDSTGKVDEYQASLPISNGVIEANFHNPYSDNQGRWSSGFIFRSDSFERFYVLVLNSWGNRFFGFRDGDPNNELTLTEERSEHINTSYPGENGIRIIINDEIGFLFINDEYIQSLDLSRSVDSGYISAVGTYYFEDGIPGESTRYEGFTIWSADKR